jgi:hypothetical protein
MAFPPSWILTYISASNVGGYTCHMMSCSLFLPEKNVNQHSSIRALFEMDRYMPVYHTVSSFFPEFHTITYKYITFVYLFPSFSWYIIFFFGNRVSSVRIVSDYGLGNGWLAFDSRQRQRIFTLASVSSPAVGPTQPLVQWVSAVRSPWVKRGLGVMLIIHPHLMPRLRMRRSSSPTKRLHGSIYITFISFFRF